MHFVPWLHVSNGILCRGGQALPSPATRSWWLRSCLMRSVIVSKITSCQGLTLTHFKAQLEDRREYLAHVRAQLEHLRDTSTG